MMSLLWPPWVVLHRYDQFYVCHVAQGGQGKYNPCHCCWCYSAKLCQWKCCFSKGCVPLTLTVMVVNGTCTLSTIYNHDNHGHQWYPAFTKAAFPLAKFSAITPVTDDVLALATLGGATQIVSFLCVLCCQGKYTLCCCCWCYRVKLCHGKTAFFKGWIPLTMTVMVGNGP